MNKSLFLVAAAALTAASAFSACTSRSGPTTPPVELAAPVPGRPALKFDYQESTELVVIKNDTATGDRWSARFQRKGSSKLERENWEIVSAPDGRQLIDRLADGRFILHLLDTLGTYSTLAEAAHGAAASYGLDTPRFELHWTAGNEHFELKIGQETRIEREGSPETGYFSQPRIGGKAYPVLVMNGAAIPMLGNITSFDSLRRRTWSTLDADDIDAYEVRRGGHEVFYAERMNNGWVGRNKKRAAKGADDRLQGLSHSRILNFVDEADRTSAIEAKLKSSPLAEIIAQGRFETPARFVVTREAGRLYGAVSTRPGAVFELYPEIERFFK